MVRGTPPQESIGMTISSLELRQDAPAAAGRGSSRVWGAIGGLYLMGFATSALCVVGWRSLDMLESRLTEDSLAEQEFNAGLVEAIEQLSESTGALTSADLCPVKFRLRCTSEAGSVPPLRSIAADLFVQSDDGSFQRCSSSSSRISGLIDFGLCEPGRYRVRMHSPDGLSLEHEFDVLPGVPVDRLVRCPGGSPNGTECSIAIDWPEELTQVRLAAACRIVPCGFEEDGWIWSPDIHAGAEVAWIQNCGIMPGEVEFAESVVTGLAPEIGQSEGKLIVHSRYSQLDEIVFVRLPDTGEAGRPEVIGRARFGDGLPATEPVAWSLPDSVPLWIVNRPAPRWEAGGVGHWALDLADDLEERLLFEISNQLDQATSLQHVTDPSAANLVLSPISAPAALHLLDGTQIASAAQGGDGIQGKASH